MAPKLSPQIRVIALVLTATCSASAVNATWNGTTDPTWATVTNWSSDPNPVPGTGQTATFDNGGNLNTTIDLGAGVTIGSIAFSTASVAAYTLGTGVVGTQALTLDDNGSIILNSGINANQIVNAALTLGADGTAQSYAITDSDSNNSITFAGSVTGGTGGIAGAKTLNVNSSSSGGVNFNGLVSNGGATSLGITKTGGGVMNLGSVAHTFTGGVNVQAGTLTIGGSGSANSSTIFLGDVANTGASVKIGVVNSGTNPASPLTVVAQTSGTATTRILGTNSSTSGQWSGPITMNDDLTVGTSTAGGFTLQSAATVNLNAKTLTLSNASTTSAINVSAKGIISGLGGNVVVSNTSTGTPTLGLVIMEGDNTYTGTTTISAGTLQVGNNGATGSFASTSGVINNGTLVFKRTGTLNQGGPISGTGPVLLTANGNVTFNQANTYAGTTTVGNGGKLTVAAGGSIFPTTAVALTLGNGSGAGILQYDSAATSKFSSINIGNGTNNAGTLNQTAGTINGTSMTLNGGFSGTGNGNVNLSGGAFVLTGNVSGSSQTAADNFFSTITVSDTAAFSAATVYLTGSPAAGRYAAGRFTQEGGTVTLSGVLTMARTTATNTFARRGEYNLNGGTLTVTQIDQNVGADTFGTFNFNGGTLKPQADKLTFMEGITTVQVRDNGALIDTNGKNITIGQSIIHSTIGGDAAADGGLTKSGPGALTLTGTNTYTGATTVTGGTLNINGPLGTGANVVNVNSGAANFGVSQTLAALNIGAGAVVTFGAPAPALAPAFGGGGEIDGPLFSQAEMPVLQGVPEPGSAALLLAGMVSLLGARRRRADCGEF